MNILWFLIVPIVVIALVISLRVWRQRRPRSIEASLREFREGLDALDPKNSPASRNDRIDARNRPLPDSRQRRQ